MATPPSSATSPSPPMPYRNPTVAPPQVPPSAPADHADREQRKIGLSARAVGKENDPGDIRTYYDTGEGMASLGELANLFPRTAASAPEPEPDAEPEAAVEAAPEAQTETEVQTETEAQTETDAEPKDAAAPEVEAAHPEGDASEEPAAENQGEGSSEE